MDRSSPLDSAQTDSDGEFPIRNHFSCSGQILKKVRKSGRFPEVYLIHPVRPHGLVWDFLKVGTFCGAGLEDRTKSRLIFVLAAYFKGRKVESFSTNLRRIIEDQEIVACLEEFVVGEVYESDSQNNLVIGKNWSQYKTTMLDQLPGETEEISEAVDDLAFTMFDFTLRPQKYLPRETVKIKYSLTVSKYFEYAKGFLHKNHDEEAKFGIITYSLIQLLIARILVPQIADSGTMFLSNFSCIGCGFPHVYRDCHLYKSLVFFALGKGDKTSEDDLLEFFEGYCTKETLLIDLKELERERIIEKTIDKQDKARRSIFKPGKNFHREIEWKFKSYRKSSGVGKHYEELCRLLDGLVRAKGHIRLNDLFQEFVEAGSPHEIAKFNEHHLFESILSEMLENGKLIVVAGGLESVGSKR